MEKDLTSNRINFSVVVYKTSPAEIEKLYNSIINTKIDWVLYIVDNSPTDELKNVCSSDSRVKYIFTGKNIGFGAAHNIAFRNSIVQQVDFHVVINPDIYFEGDVISPMVRFMTSDPSIGMAMPEILYPNGDVQYLPKLLPSPLSILKRKIKKPQDSYKRFIEKYELRNIPRSTVYNAPILSGCFTVVNVKALETVGLYDDRYFMYFEDFDLSRRVHYHYKTIYFPLVSVYHGYAGDANRNFKLFMIFIKSAFHYFNKWGWFFDNTRKKINSSITTLKWDRH